MKCPPKLRKPSNLDEGTWYNLSHEASLLANLCFDCTIPNKRSITVPSNIDAGQMKPESQGPIVRDSICIKLENRQNRSPLSEARTEIVLEEQV